MSNGTVLMMICLAWVIAVVLVACFGKVDPPWKFAGVGVVCWKFNHVKFSYLVKLAFKDLFSLDWELWCGWFEHCGFVSLEQFGWLSFAELVHGQQ